MAGMFSVYQWVILAKTTYQTTNSVKTPKLHVVIFYLWETLGKLVMLNMVKSHRLPIVFVEPTSASFLAK